MRTLFLLTLITGFTQFGMANIGNDWISDTCELKGPVKAIKYNSKYLYNPKDDDWEKYTYEYNPQGYMIRHNRSSSWGGENFNAYYRIFDESGAKCQVAYYIQDGDTASWTKFYYDKNGNWEKSNYYSWGRLYNTGTYTYNNKNQLTSSAITTVKGAVFPEAFQYDDNGRLIYHEDLSSTVKEYTYWIYDDRGMLIEEKFIDSNWASKTTVYMGNDSEPDSSKTEDYSNKANTEDSYIIRYKYNEQGHKIETVKSDIEGKTLFIITLTYNQQGDPITKTVYDAKKDRTTTYTHEYKYDKYDNWISKVTKCEGELFRKESQKIKYYKE